MSAKLPVDGRPHLDSSLPQSARRPPGRRLARHLISLGILLPTLSNPAAVHDVGPGHPLATPSEVPWESLNPGDIVRIHWRATAYRDKWVIARQGTPAQPILVQGVPGPLGERPVIDGDGASTRLALDYWSEGRGVIKVGGASLPNSPNASYIVIEGLEIRSARPPFTYRDDGNATQSYPNNAAAIFVEQGDHVTIRDCALHDCGNGLFVAAASSAVLVEGNHIHDNGNVGSIYEHNSYTAAAGITFQFNHYGPLRIGCEGNNLKDRSAGTVIRYNWIESGNRQLDLVDAEDSVALQQDPRYRTTFVYGNLLIEPDGAGNSQIVHYGGDSGNTPTYRKGTLHFFQNTMVSTRSGNTTLLRLSTNDEQADCRNNLLFVTAPGSRLALLAEAGTLALTHNWMKPGRVTSHAGTSFTGSVSDDGTSVTGPDPGFIDPVTQNLHLRTNSACRSAATALHPTASSDHTPAWQYRRHQEHEPRRNGSTDLGAYGFSPFEAWRGEKFGDQAENDAVSGEDADPDLDGLRNLVEYAFELDPWVASTAGPLRPVTLALPGGPYFAVEFHRRLPPSELIYETRVTDDFVTWAPGCEYSDTGGGLPTPHTTDASDSQWTRVRLNQGLDFLPHQFVGVRVRREVR